MAQIGETDTQSVFYVLICVFLTHLVSITHLPFQATNSMSGGSGAEDWMSAAGSTPTSSEENSLDRNEYPDEGATAASAKGLGYRAAHLHMC